MSQSFETEYTELHMLFDRKLVKAFISELIHSGYSIYWNESVQHFIIAIRSGRRLIKLKFDRTDEGYCLNGSYTLKDIRLSELLERMISDTKGSAVVKRFHDELIFIDSIVSGELVERLEIDGDQRKTVFAKPLPLPDARARMEQLFQSTQVEDRIVALRAELDEALETLIHLIEQDAGEEEREVVVRRLQEIRKELLWTESL
jgi:hypothetical protein